MTFRGVTVLKFVGTVSLGLLTGLSFTLSTVTVPTLLTLPSARTAAKAFRSLADAATFQLRLLSGVASSAFFLAFLASPRYARHPYLLYTSLLVLGGRLFTSDSLTPYLFSATSSSATSSTLANSPAFALSPPKDSRRSASHMEASYEVLGSATAGSASGSVSDSHSDGAGSDVDPLDTATPVNGEEVRAAVEVFLKKQIVRTTLTGLAFVMAVVGIWGDSASPSWQSETFIVI